MRTQCEYTDKERHADFDEAKLEYKCGGGWWYKQLINNLLFKRLCLQPPVNN